MRFSEYFNDWLYGKDGYYTTFKTIGKSGDFFTSVSTSQFFGGSIANYLIRRIDEGVIDKDAMVLEIGAHKGFLLRDIVVFLYTLRPELLSTLKFGVVERFSAIALEIEKFVEEHIGSSISFKIYPSLETVSERCGFVYANEIFDAFACELLYNGKFANIDGGKIVFNTSDTELLEKCERLGIFKGEIAVGYEEYAKAMSKAFNKLEFLTFDYGQEYPRNDFSVRIYKNHKTFPLFEIEDFGEFYKHSDITIDVNFEHLTNAFEMNGFERLFYKTQMSALIDFGIHELLEILAKKASEEAYFAELSKAKLLLSPSHFGERFKAISFIKKGKHMNISVNGEVYELSQRSTVDDLLAQIGLSSDKVMACAVDGMIVKKDEWSIFELGDGQKVELLNFVGGG